MEKLDMQSKNLVDKNINKIAELFPNCITEGKNEKGQVVKLVDFDLLKQELSKDIVEGNDERYTLNWAGKKQAILTANSPINATLRPCREESVDFDNTKNLYIEGDNLDVLKLLRETYLGKVKMIYIDPPYNTRKDLVYKDNFDIDKNTYVEMSKQEDEEGNRMFQNTETNGRFHSDWVSMMYARLKVAKDLLTDDGIVFISIDDNEVNNLNKICDEIFGESNFIARMIIDGTPKNDPLIISTAHEYVLVYVKNYSTAKELDWGIKNPIYDKLLEIFEKNKPNYKIIEQEVKNFYLVNNLQDDNISNYKFVDEYGIYRTGPIDDPQSGGSRDVRYNPITGATLKTPNRGWGCSLETWKEWINNHEIFFPEDNSKLCSRKVYIQKGKLDLLRAIYKFQTRKDTDMLKNLFDGVKVFQFPKPIELIKMILDSSTNKDEVIMDFFSGSGTTGHAVMELNQERINNGIKDQVKFILVQLRENLEENLKNAKGNREKQTAQNAINFCNYNNLPPFVTEIAKERIRRAGKKIKEENQMTSQALDVGFRVLKLDSSNMKDVYYRPAELNQASLLDYVSNIKEDRTPEDLLFQVMLDMGVMLSSEIKTIDIKSKKVFNVNDGNLVCCFDNDLTDEVVTEIAKMQPLYAVFRDSSMSSDSVAVNFDQIFETYSPTTTRKVL